MNELQSMISINQYQSVIQTNNDIVNGHDGVIKVESKKVKELDLLFKYILKANSYFGIK